MRYLETNSLDPAYNLAFEEYFLKLDAEEDILILWQNDKSVIIGLNQNPEEEINIDFVRSNGIKLVRRCTGGGAVYHDTGNLNYSLICSYDPNGDFALDVFSTRVCGALRKLGVPAEVGGRNDIFVNGLKVSGAAQRLYGNRILHHGCLLFRSDPAMISGALSPQPLKYVSKSTKSVRSSIANIADFLPQDFQLEQFWQHLLLELSKGEFSPYCPTDSDMHAIRELMQSKYRREDWTWRCARPYNLMNQKKYPGGIIAFHLTFEGPRIRDIRFSGDYMARQDAEPVENALRGVVFAPHDVREILSRFPLEEYFGSITLDMLEELLFSA